MQPIKLSKANRGVKKILGATFPEYTGRKVKLVFVESLTMHDVHWGGGTKNTYRGVRADGSEFGFREGNPWDGTSAENKRITLTRDFLVVCETIFCGEHCGITIYAHPSYSPKWLTA